MAYPQNSTLCWTCEWAAGKDGKCPWACSFKPVPGWNAEATSILGNNKRYDSFIVHDCPLYTLANFIKQKIVVAAGKRVYIVNQKEKAELYKTIKELRDEEKMSYQQIADELGFDIKQIYRFSKKMKEREERG